VLIDSLGSTTTSSLIAHDNERLTLFLDSIVDVVTGLSEQEKLQFAEFMAANDHWMAEISTASAELFESRESGAPRDR
jgi:cAMP phosphodiesterase